jgi:hypothetical protein
LTEGEITKKSINRASFLKNLPLPLFTKERYYFPSLWQREGRRDFIINVFIHAILLVIRCGTAGLHNYGTISQRGGPVPFRDILSREKDLQKPIYRHTILVRGADFQACKARVLDFFQQYQLVRYSHIAVLENESLPASEPGFGDRLHQAIVENQRILHELIEELQREGVKTLNNIEDIPQGYKTKMLHVITHLVDGFFGIDTSFYNFEEDSHWVTDDYRGKMALEPSRYWLLSLEARI